jgi:DedD protein
MEKEQKKLLLVAVSVGVFLLVTVTAGIILLTPKIQTQGTSFYSSAPAPVPFQPGRIQDVEVTANEPLQPIYNNSNETSIVINGVSETPIVNKNDEDKLTIQIPKPTTAAVPDAPEIPASKVVSPAAVKPQTTAVASKPAAQTAVSPSPSPRPTASTRPAVSTRPAAASTRAPAPARTINDYWIQTGAYSSMVRAEDVKELLSSNGLTSIIENRIIDGKTLYRVRLGPYTSEKEANYWLSLVKSINDFSDSQVRQTTRQQL